MTQRFWGRGYGKLFAAAALLFAGCSGYRNPCGQCDDAVACTRDVCNLQTRQCEHIPDDSRCPQNQWCDVALGCEYAPECQADRDCDDGNPCTDEWCEQNSCRRRVNQAECDDADPCTEGDICQDGRCQPGQNVCQCRADGDCASFEDGNLCNGTLTCQEGFCRLDPSTVVVCDDSADSQCRKNTCQPQSGQCLMENLQDGTPCNELPPCFTNGVCQAGSCSGTPVTCDDGNICTDDSCDPQSGQCRYLPNQLACDDGDGCTGKDVCRDGACRGQIELCCADGADNDGDGAGDCYDSDCTASPACACADVAAPSEPPFEPLEGMQPAGRCESTTRDGFSDEYLYDGNNYLKVGIRRDWGGSVIFYGLVGNYGPGMNPTNTIDANDTGREVQVAFYDPDRILQNCAWDASCQSRPSDCPVSITYLGWNPVQGGNRCNVGSGLAGFACSDGVMTAVVDPLFWNPAWDRQDCFSDVCSDPNLRARRSDVRVTQRLRFIRTHVLELDYTLQNLSDLEHRANDQEMPTVYTANGRGGPDLWRLFASDGREIAINNPGNDGFFYADFESPAGWATMQNDDLSYGVGLYAENRIIRFQGWQNRSLPFNNFRAVQNFAIPARGAVRARAYLLIGSFQTIAAEAGWLESSIPPFGVLDSPAAEAELRGDVPVWGWALDNKGVTGAELVIDGQSVVSLQYGTSRPDVCLVWPGYPHCPAVGFQGVLSAGAFSPCPHILELRLRDGDGNQRIVARRRIWVKR